MSNNISDQESSTNSTPEKAATPSRPGAMRISFPTHSNSDNYEAYQRRIKEQLSKNEMPAIVLESGRLVAEGESAEGDIVIAYVRKVLDKLSLARMGKPCPELKIFLSDQAGINTGVITEAQTPIFVVGLGMIDKILQHGFGEDQVAAIFGHERFHLKRHEKWKDLTNGRPEETVADVWGVMEAADAGYNPQALGQFFGALRNEVKTRADEETQGWGNVLGSLIDEHPNLDNRIRTTELAIANLQLKKRLTETQTPIPPDVIEAAKQVKFMSSWEHHKQENNFDAATPDKKVYIIAEYMTVQLNKKNGREKKMDPALADFLIKMNIPPKEEEDSTTPDPWLIAHRLAAAYEDLKALREVDGAKEAARKQLYALASKTSPDRDLDNHYLWILEQFVDLQSLEPRKERNKYSLYQTFELPDRHNHHRIPEGVPADLLRLKTTGEAFWAAKTKEDALAAASLYEQAARELAPYTPGINTLGLRPEDPKWPRRKDIRKQIANKGYARLPWENQLQWALTSTGEEGDLLKLTMINLGCDDMRLTGRYSKDTYYDRFDIYELTMDAKGNISALTMSDQERKEESQKRFKAKTAAELLKREYKRQRARETAEEKLIQTADWTELERDFWGFIAKHADTLAPDSSVIPGKSPFAQEFMKRFQALNTADPAKWEQDYAAFLTGCYPDGRNKDKYGSLTLQTNSLPDLIKKAGDTYLGYIEPFSYSSRRSFEATRGKLPEGHPLQELLDSFHDQRKPRHVSYDEKKTGRWVSYQRQPRPVPPAHEKVEIDIRIDTEHPYVKALLVLDKKYLSSGRKGALLVHFRYENPEATHVEEFFTISPSTIFNYAACRTAHALKGIEAKVTGGLNDQHHQIMTQIEMLEFLKTLRRLDRAMEDERFSISQMSFWQVTGEFFFLHDKKLAASVSQERTELITRQLERNCRIDFAPDVSLKTLINRFIADHGGDTKVGTKSNNIFATRPELEKLYLQQIRRRIMKLSPAKRVAPLEQLMTMQLQDPAYRAWAISRWVDAVALSTGKDQGAPAYATKTLESIKTSIKHLNAAQGIGCVTTLMEKIEAQRAIALGAKEILTEVYGQQFLEQDGAMRVVESAVSTCASDPNLRQAFLKYITAPLSKSSTRSFISALKKSVYKAEEYSVSSAFIKQFYNPKDRVIVSPAQERMIVDSLHQNLWAMPFEMRTVYLDRILFPVGQKKEGEFDKAVDFVLDKVLPPERKFSAEAREALKIYLDCCPSELRRVSFSAILATTRRTKGEDSLRLGQVLSYVFSRTGAAGGQLLQAAHSYLSGINVTDPDLIQLRDDLKSSKVDFQRPFRWEIFERIDEALSEDARKSIKRVGSLLGCGSTAYVVAEEKDSGESALKLMRRDVIPIADLQFERYGQAFARLAQQQDYYAPLPAMVDHARQLIKVSAQGTVAAEQVTYAQESYDPVEVTVNSERYGFKVASVLSYGPEYLETKLVSGVHLNDLDPTDALSAQNRKNLSIAAEVVELYNMSLGRACDQDRHGYQQKIKGNTIGIFDVGAIPFDPEREKVTAPSSSEKRSLGRLLGLTFNAALAGKPPIEAFVNAISDREWGNSKSYLVGIKRALLARMDIHAGFGETPEEKADVLTAIFIAVAKTGRVDPAIFEGLCETTDLNACRHLVAMTMNGRKSAAEITITDSHTSFTTPKLSLTSIVSTIAKAGLKRAFNRVGYGTKTEKDDRLPPFPTSNPDTPPPLN